MGIWSILTKSLGLLGKPVEIPNKQRRFGSALSYIAIQIEHDGKYDSAFSDGEEEVLLFTRAEIDRARTRAEKNPEDVVSFLEDHKIRNLVD